VHPAVLKGERGRHKEKVEDKHGDAEALGHPPAGAEDAHEDQAQHRKEHDYGAAQALARHLDGRHEDAGVEEPGQGQPGLDARMGGEEEGGGGLKSTNMVEGAQLAAIHRIQSKCTKVFLHHLTALHMCDIYMNMTAMMNIL
jgi:hypothetical protein